MECSLWPACYVYHQPDLQSLLSHFPLHSSLSSNPLRSTVCDFNHWRKAKTVSHYHLPVYAIYTFTQPSHHAWQTPNPLCLHPWTYEKFTAGHTARTIFMDIEPSYEPRYTTQHPNRVSIPFPTSSINQSHPPTLQESPITTATLPIPHQSTKRASRAPTATSSRRSDKRSR